MRLFALAALPLGAALLAQTTPPRGEDQRPAGQVPKTGPVTAANLTPVKVQEPTGVCSIPLKNVLRTDPRDHIAITVTPPPSQAAPGQSTSMPEVKPPAPPCDHKKR